MANEITEQIRAAVWNDPQPAMNATKYSGEWTRGGNAWNWKRGVVRLTRTLSGNIYIHGNTGSGIAGTSTGVIDFLALEWNTDTAETVRRLCRGTAGARARRLFTKNQLEEYAPKIGYIYIERLKAREGVTGLWALLPYDGESGQIDATATPETSTQGATDYTDGELDF